MSAKPLKGTLVLVIIDRGETKGGGTIPLRDVRLVESTNAGRETLLYHNDVSAVLADQIAGSLIDRGIAVEDVSDPWEPAEVSG